MILALPASFYLYICLLLHMNGNFLAGFGLHVLVMICVLMHVSGAFCNAHLLKLDFLSSSLQALAHTCWQNASA